jgi:hypothetical protein
MSSFLDIRVSQPRVWQQDFVSISDTHIVPHPLFATFELRVQTDGEITPKEAVVNCCKSLVSDLEILSREFTKEYELRKMVSGDAAVVDK